MSAFEMASFADRRPTQRKRPLFCRPKWIPVLDGLCSCCCNRVQRGILGSKKGEATTLFRPRAKTFLQLLVLLATFQYFVKRFVTLFEGEQRLMARSTPPTLYFIVTASLRTDEIGERDALKRREQYIRGISRLLEATSSGFPTPHKVIVVENSAQWPTFLDSFEGVSVLYTSSNNSSSTGYKGTKELGDVLACTRHFEMQPHDLIVKMTGRYYLAQDNNGETASSFMKILHTLNWNKTQAIVKFGYYENPLNSRVPDCITGLIMMPVHAIRQIVPTQIIEHSWAKAALALPSSTVIAVQGAMGIFIAPAGAEYFKV